MSVELVYAKLNSFRLRNNGIDRYATEEEK